MSEVLVNGVACCLGPAQRAHSLQGGAPDARASPRIVGATGFRSL